MNKKSQLIIALFAIFLILGIILSVFLFYTRSASQPAAQPPGRCGDGICQDVELRTGLCPDDCVIVDVTNGGIKVKEPLYITLVIHSEEDFDGGRAVPSIPDYDGNQEIFEHYAAVLLDLGKVFQKHGAVINYQPDWTFVQGVLNFDPDFFQKFTAMGHAVDPHAHESHVSYKELKNVLTTANADPSFVLGGINMGDSGWMSYVNSLYPDYKALCCLKDVQTQQSDTTGYVWTLGSAGDWKKDTADGKIVYIGQNLAGIHKQWPDSSVFQQALAGRQEGKVNTFYPFDALRWFTPQNADERIQEYDDWLTNVVDPLVEQGEVEWKTLEQIYNIYIGKK